MIEETFDSAEALPKKKSLKEKRKRGMDKLKALKKMKDSNIPE